MNAKPMMGHGDELAPWWEPEPEWLTPWVVEKLKSGEKPPLEARNERERNFIMAWTIRWLVETDEAISRITNRGSSKKRFAMQAAERGNAGPLRKLYPEIARYIHPPQRGRGEYPRDKKFTAVKAAAEDARRIRALWKGRGKKNRRAEEETKPTAEEIAAERWDVKPEQVKRAKKKLKGVKKKPTR